MMIRKRIISHTEHAPLKSTTVAPPHLYSRSQGALCFACQQHCLVRALAVQLLVLVLASAADAQSLLLAGCWLFFFLDNRLAMWRCAASCCQQRFQSGVVLQAQRRDAWG